MRTLNIQLHHADRDHVIPEFPAQYLRALFRPHDIELHFPEGASLNSDPKTEEQYQASLQSVIPTSPQPGDDAHLIIGNEWWGPGGGATNGYLLHSNRGGGAVFTLSDALIEGSPYTFAQVCAHEIGHMLNLVHGDAAADYPSTMDPDARRTTNTTLIEAAWQEVDGEPIGNSRLLPLSDASGQYLGQSYSQPDEVYPWGTEFRDLEDGFDRSTTTLQLSLSPERPAYFQHEPFGCRIVLRNGGRRTRRVPNELHPDTVDLRIIITRPDGVQYVHRGRGRCCQQHSKSLAPGQETNDSFVLFGGPFGALFDQPGSYQFDVKTSVGASATVAVPVHANEKLLCTQTFTRHLLDGAPTQNAYQHRRALGVLKTRARKCASIRPLVALKLAAQYHEPKRRSAMVRCALNANGPQRVREDALLLASLYAQTDRQRHRIRQSATDSGLVLSDRGVACLDRLDG